MTSLKSPVFLLLMGLILLLLGYMFSPETLRPDIRLEKVFSNTMANKLSHGLKIIGACSILISCIIGLSKY